MKIDKNNNEYNFSDLDEELNDYEVEKGKIAGFDFDALDFEESKKENSKKQEPLSRTEKKSGRTAKKRRVLPKVDYEKLVGPDGLVKLKEQGPKLKFMNHKKSKNATIDNLGTLIKFYQTWAHGLCPQLKFKDAISQSENVCKDKRLKNYLDTLREEAKNNQNERNDYLSGKTLADEESEFWHTPSQSASRNKRLSSFEDKLKEDLISQNHDEDLTATPFRLTIGDNLTIGNDSAAGIDLTFGNDFTFGNGNDLILENELEEIVQSTDSPIKDNILRPRRLVYDDEVDDIDDSALTNKSQEIMLDIGSYPLSSFKDQEELYDDDILGDSPDIQIPIIQNDQNKVFEDIVSPCESRDDILGNNNLVSNMDIDQVYEDPNLSPRMNLSPSRRNFLIKDQDENDDMTGAGSDKENLQPTTIDLPMSKGSTLFFDLGDRYVDLTPIYEEVNGLD